MKDPISMLKEIVKDPVELTSITLPSAALVAVFFVYRGQIHPVLKDLPDPIAGNPYGALLFIVVSLITSLVVKVVSHDLLNWTYDILYRDYKRKNQDWWYNRAKNARLLPDDPKLSTYEKAVTELKKRKSPITSEIELLQIQSKLARSISLIFLLFAAILSIGFTWVLVAICLFFSLFMWYTFCKFRWEASELVYKTIYELSARLN